MSLVINHKGALEEWKDVEGYEGIYQVSNLGRVKNISPSVDTNRYRPHIKNHRIIRFCKNKGGYFKFNLCRDGDHKLVSVHRIVANAFIPNPLNLPQINHKNGIKTDNRVDNLEWTTNRDNIIHAYKNGLINTAKGVNHGSAKLTESKVIEIRGRYGKEKTSCCKMAKEYEMSPTNIHRIIKRKIWAHI